MCFAHISYGFISGKNKKKAQGYTFYIYMHSSLIDELANHNKLILTAYKILIASFKNKTDDIQS